MPITKEGIIRFLRSDASFRVFGFLIILVALLNVVDGIQTQVGIRAGIAKENWSFSVMIIHQYGLNALIELKAGVVVACALAYFVFRWRWKRTPVIARLLLLAIVFGVAIEYWYVVFHNLWVVLGQG